MNNGRKSLCIASLGMVLALGVIPDVRAEHSPGSSDVMKTDSLTEAQKYNFQSDDDKQQNVNEEKGSAQAGGKKTIKGELFRVDDANYFVKAKDGSEVRLHTDKTTKMVGTIKKGDQIQATINDQNHALSIQAIRPNKK